MSQQRAFASQFRLAPQRTQRGWIGIDIGSRLIKMAQVEQVGSRYRISARWTLRGNRQSILTRDEIGSKELKSSLLQFKSLRRLLMGRNCAVVLSMSMVDFRVIEIPRGNPAEENRMIGEELAADLGLEPHALAFDGWEVSNDYGADANLTRIATIAMPKTVAEELNDALLGAGLECQTLNAMPCALARAVEMAEPDQTDQAVIALDLGYTSPLIVLIQGGRPVFARSLRDVGLNSLMQPLEKHLHLTSDESHQLLTRYGVAVTSQPPVVATQKTMQIIADPLHHLMTEIRRTIDYIGTQFRAHKPQRIYLFGGGALVNNLPEYLTQEIRLPALRWMLGGDHSDASDPLYGVAASLSSLTWEAGACS